MGEWRGRIGSWEVGLVGLFLVCGMEGGDVRVRLVAASGDIRGAEDVEAAPAFETQVRRAVV